MSDTKYWRNKGFLLCPYCDHKIKDWWDYEFNIRDDEHTEIDCPSCENNIAVGINISVYFTTAKMEKKDE